LAAQRRHVNLSKYTTNGSKLRNPLCKITCQTYAQVAYLQA
ncbi:MAG: hypothetical protein ACI9HB_000680, partial [Gammaproteobacteria bacterium]